MLAPCALGGILDDDDLRALRCQSDRRRRQQPARRRRGSPTCSRRAGSCGPRTSSCNAGGIINIAGRARAEGYDARARRARVRAIGDTLRDLARRGGRRRLDRGDGRRAANGVRRAPAAHRASGRPPPASSGAHTLWQPALLPQLVQVRGERDRGGRANWPARRPRRASSSSSTARRPASSAASSAARGRARCATYSSSFAAGRSRAGRAPGTAPRARARAAAPGRRDSRRARRVGRDEHAALAEHGVAGEAPRVPATNARWSARGRACERLERSELVAVAEHDVAPRAAAASGADAEPRRARGTASAWSGWSCVSAIPPSAAAAHATSSASASSAPVSAGPGSTTHAGSRPTIHVFVPRQRERARVVGARTQRDVDVAPARRIQRGSSR